MCGKFFFRLLLSNRYARPMIPIHRKYNYLTGNMVAVHKVNTAENKRAKYKINFPILKIDLQIFEKYCVGPTYRSDNVGGPTSVFTGVTCLYKPTRCSNANAYIRAAIANRGPIHMVYIYIYTVYTI